MRITKYPQCRGPSTVKIDHLYRKYQGVFYVTFFTLSKADSMKASSFRLKKYQIFLKKPAGLSKGTF